MSEKERLFIELCKREYRVFTAFSHSGRWQAGRAVSYICRRLQEFLAEDTGNAYDILVLSMPPQHGKSMTVTETLPAWFLINHPEKRVIEISYSEDFAQLFGRRNRSKLMEYGGLFGVQLSASPNSNTEFETERGGGMISRGVMSGVTGRPCELMIIDDPIKNRMEADSETYRERLWAEWQDSFKTRLARGAKVILIQTRWHEDDLAGRIISNERNVTVINLPCEAEEDDILGREKGEALCPEIGKDAKWLKDFRESYDGGTRTWTALYQGRPSCKEGNILKRGWWRRYDAKDAPEFARTVISVDAAFKDGDMNDNVAVSVWGKRDADIYLIEMVCGHMDFVETVEKIEELSKKYPRYNAIYIEDKANGSAVISYLRRNIPGIIAVEPKGGKVARVNAVSGVIEAGNVYLPEKGSNVEAFIEECAAFPRGAHDDMVDSMSQALSREYYKSAAVAGSSRKRSRQFEFYDPPKRPFGKGARVRAF